MNIARALAVAAIAILGAAPFWAADFTVTLLNYIGIYTLVALGVVLLTGVGGLTSFGQAAFVGIGAYATAWLTTATGASPWLGLVFALILTGLVAALLGAVTLRLSGHYLPLGTIAWGLAIYYLLGNIEALGGNNGINGVPPISIGSLSFASNLAIFYLIWCAVVLAMIVVANLLESREGRAIRSLRGGAVMVESLGINLFRIRLVTFVMAALLAGLSGWLYAHMSRYVSPAPFNVRMSIEYLFMAILGGSGYILGAVVGAAALTMLANVLQDVLPHFSSNGEQLAAIIFAIVYVLAIQFARGGIMPIVLRFLPRGSKTTTAGVGSLPRRTMPRPWLLHCQGGAACRLCARGRNPRTSRLCRRAESSGHAAPDRDERQPRVQMARLYRPLARRQVRQGDAGVQFIDVPTFRCHAAGIRRPQRFDITSLRSQGSAPHGVSGGPGHLRGRAGGKNHCDVSRELPSISPGGKLPRRFC
jgi:branched-chain amino acid transport system permease protein